MIPCEHSPINKNKLLMLLSYFVFEHKIINRISGNGRCVKCGADIRPPEKSIPSPQCRLFVYYLSGFPIAILIRICDCLGFDRSISGNLQTLSIVIALLGPPVLSMIVIRVIYCINLLRYSWIVTPATISNEENVVQVYEANAKKRKALVYDAAWSMLSYWLADRLLTLFL